MSRLNRRHCLSSIAMLTAVCIGSGQAILAESGQPEVKAGPPTSTPTGFASQLSGLLGAIIGPTDSGGGGDADEEDSGS